MALDEGRKEHKQNMSHVKFFFKENETLDNMSCVARR